MFYRLGARRDLDPISFGDAMRVLYRYRRDFAIPFDLAFPQTSRWICRERLANLIQTCFLAAGTRIEYKDFHLSVWPTPVLHFRQIVAVLVHILFVLHQLVTQELLEV